VDQPTGLGTLQTYGGLIRACVVSSSCLRFIPVAVQAGATRLQYGTLLVHAIGTSWHVGACWCAACVRVCCLCGGRVGQTPCPMATWHGDRRLVFSTTARRTGGCCYGRVQTHDQQGQVHVAAGQDRTTKATTTRSHYSTTTKTRNGGQSCVSFKSPLSYSSVL
jgi:hypothetical protein